MRLLILTALSSAGAVWLWLRRSGRWHDLRDRVRTQWTACMQWVFWSPRRLAAVVAAVAVLGWGWAAAQPSAPAAPTTASDQDRGLPDGWRRWTRVSATPGPGSATPTPGPPSGSPDSTTPTPAATSDPASASPDTVRAGVTAASTAFVRAWTLRAPVARRTAALRAVATTRLVNVLGPIDGRELPVTTGAPVVRDADRQGAVVAVPITGGAHAVLHLSPGPSSTGWVVDAVSEEGPA